MERVLILTGDAGEELEVYYMLYRLREAGYDVDVAAPERKRLQLVVHDFGRHARPGGAAGPVDPLCRAVRRGDPI